MDKQANRADRLVSLLGLVSPCIMAIGNYAECVFFPSSSERFDRRNEGRVSLVREDNLTGLAESI